MVDVVAGLRCGTEIKADDCSATASASTSRVEMSEYCAARVDARSSGK